jgi:hypothetical protein
MPRKIRVATVVDRRPRGAITCLGVDKVNKPEVVSYIPLQLHNYTALHPWSVKVHTSRSSISRRSVQWVPLPLPPPHLKPRKRKRRTYSYLHSHPFRFACCPVMLLILIPYQTNHTISIRYLLNERLIDGKQVRSCPPPLIHANSTLQPHSLTKLLEATMQCINIWLLVGFYFKQLMEASLSSQYFALPAEKDSTLIPPFQISRRTKKD